MSKLKTAFVFLVLAFVLGGSQNVFAVTCGADTGYGGADQYGSCAVGTCTGTDVCRWNSATNVCACVPANRDCARSSGDGLCAFPPSMIGGRCGPRGNGFRCE